MMHHSAYMTALVGATVAVLFGCILGADARIQGKILGHGHHGGHGGYGHRHGHGHHHNHHHYNPCGNIYAGHEFCRHKHAGHYGHHNKKCYIQCDDWGRGYVRPCAKGTYWYGGKGPSKFNKCAGRNHKNRGYGGYGGGYGGYGGGYGGKRYGGGGYGFGGFGGYGGAYGK